MFTLQNSESRMRRASFRWTVNILLAAVIFLNAELGHLLGIKSLALSISVVWPATGFALAAILIFGSRAWSGIFLGNFISNFLHLFLGGNGYLELLAVASAISAGSLLEVILGGYIIRTFSSYDYFKNVSDIFIFLLPASLITCMIASSIGVTALYLHGTLPSANLLYTWFTFWLGDSFGMYIFTPLLIVWLTQKPDVPIRENKLEALLMVLFFLLLSFLNFHWNYPITHLFIPLALWITYRFRMHGATLAIFIISLTAIGATALQYGPFVPFFAGNSLLILVSFLAVTVSVSLILAAVINERTAAWKLLQSHNIDLRQAVEMHTEELKEMHSEIFIKEKLASLGMLTLGIARQIQPPLHHINHNLKGCIDSLSRLQGSLASEVEKLEPGLAGLLTDNFKTMDNTLRNISKFEGHLNKIVHTIQEETARSSPGRIEVKPINLNTLLNICLNQALSESHKQFPELNIDVKRHFDRAVKRVSGLPEELAHAFIHLMESAIDSMKDKFDQLAEDYKPSLEVRTEELSEKIRVIIKDNGMGVSPHQIESFFQSFFNTKPLEGTSGLGLLIAHDIIVHVHHGEIKVESKEGEFLQLTITLPKISF